MLSDHAHGAANLSALHAFGPNQFRRAVPACQVDLGMTVAEYMDMGRFMIVHEDDDAETMLAKDGYRIPK